MAATVSTVPAPGDAAQPTAARRHELVAVALVAAQLVLALAVVHAFEMESRTFFNVMLLGTAGYVVHALLPLRWRLTCFVGLSFAAAAVALGPRDAVVLIVLGYVLIGLCHLPIGLRWRVMALIVTGGVFAAARADLLPLDWSRAIWPVLGSMFMFRIALYLHALAHEREPPDFMRTSAYFFMLPNVCFPLFPVVDYGAFRRNYFDREPAQIYDVGMKWIARGLLQLLLYRYVYLHLTEDPADLRTLGDVTQFVLATFLLYLRVSGQFHLIVGFLYLFGFRLPETHHLYYLASSFTDFWRRINIYWKDFMMKLVYYPSYFRLRRYGNDAGLIGATVIVFVATWLLHSYQWFWLRGGFPLEAQDGLFWASLGVLVVIGSLREIKRPRKRVAGRGPLWSPSLAFSTVATFCAICLLWSLWSADSLIGWLLMWRAAVNVAPGDLWLIGGMLIGGLALAGHHWSNWETYGGPAKPWYRHSRTLTTVSLVAMLLSAQTTWYHALSPSVAEAVASLRQSTLNARDAALQHKGYYEKLDNASRMSSHLWQTQAVKPEHWVGLSATSAYRKRDEVLWGELVPNTRIEFLDQPLTVNRWGMRDGDYEKAKAPGTYRIAILGPSHVMGSGVADGETFPDHLERLLNERVSPRTGLRYEVLNFGIAGISMLAQLGLLSDRVLSFNSDVVVFADSQNMVDSVIAGVLDALQGGHTHAYPGLDSLIRASGASALTNDGPALPFSSLRRVASSIGISTRAPWREAEQRLAASSGQLTEWILREIAAVARAHDTIPVFLALDIIVPPQKVRPREPAMARDAGMLVFDLLGMWQGTDTASLRIAPWDNHPNADGQRIIAERLLTLLEQHSVQLHLDRPHSPEME